MPLLETLPEAVETRLRDLRQQSAFAAPASNGNYTEKIETPRNGHAGNGAVAVLEREPETAALIPERDEAEDKRILFQTDLRADGAFGTEYLVVERDGVYVFAPGKNGASGLIETRTALPMTEIQSAKAETYIGNGRIEVRTATETIPLVRFSAATIGEANSVARQISSLAKGDGFKEETLQDEKKTCPKCRRVLPEDTEVCPACVNRRAVMLRLFQFLAPYKHLAIASVVVILAMTAVSMLPPFMLGKIVDALNKPAPPQTIRPVVMFVGVLFIGQILNGALQYAQRRLNAWLGAKILMDIRVAIYEKFNTLSISYYDKRSVGSVMGRVTSDSDNLWDFLTDGVPFFITNILTFVSIGGFLLYLNWQLTLLVLMPGPFLFALTRWFMPRARRKWQFLHQRINRMQSSLGSTLNGMRVVKAFAQEHRENARFIEKNDAVFAASYAANGMWASYWPVVGLLMALGTWIIYIYGGSKVLGHTMTLGMMTMFSGYLGQFYGPFQNFSRVLDWMTRSATAAERVFEVLDTEPDVRDAAQPVSMPHIRGEVEFDNVSFTYDKAKRVLDDFSLKVEPGEMIGLVGHSGAGKSTIINLLSRFYDVTEGSVKVDGVDVRQIDREDFRHQLGIVLQEPFLFPGTIMTNIAYAKPNAGVEEIMRAAKAANCHEFILKFPDGYDTQVGERGQRLSGGERQRISIARAILHDPKILILDEATASVDTETEKQIQEAISRLIQNRTTFAIAHRLSTLRNASRLVVMKDGKMTELGTHDELMEQDGEYAKLVNIQNEVNKLRAV